MSAPLKPPYGDPCNGCGRCCQEMACALSRDLLKSLKTPCIALEHAEGRYWCGLIREPHKYLGISHPWANTILAAKLSEMVAIGKGCDSTLPA